MAENVAKKLTSSICIACASWQSRLAPLIVVPGRGRFHWILLEIACRASIGEPAECGRQAHCSASSNDRQKRSVQEPKQKTKRTTKDHAQSTLNEKSCALRGGHPQRRESNRAFLGGLKTVGRAPPPPPWPAQSPLSCDRKPPCSTIPARASLPCPIAHTEHTRIKPTQSMRPA